MSKWISVKEPPEIDEWVLIYSTTRGVLVGRRPSYTDEFVWEIPSSGCGCCDDEEREVTHWMPLPEKPKD